MNSLCSRLLLACLVLASFSKLAAADSPPRNAITEYVQRAALNGAARCGAGEAIALDVPLTDETIVTYDAASERLRIFYPMQFNELTEGWNWHPEEVAAGRDYYTYKYLLLGSTHEARGSYRTSDLAGQPLEYPIQWRYDYFFAFDNPYDFYPRNAGDDAGFSAEIPLPPHEAKRLLAGDLRMALLVRLRNDCLSESTTFWKATVSAPVDFTLKKRYLIGKIDEIRFIDAASHRVITRLPARTTPPAAKR